MSIVRFFVVSLASLSVVIAPATLLAQTVNPYVSCVKCHALPTDQACGSLDRHGAGAPPAPEMACANCHDTTQHEQNPTAPPPAPYFWWRPLSGTESLMTQLCLSCHTAYNPAANHPNDVIPYNGHPYGGVPPTSVLPLFQSDGVWNQDPAAAGVVCSTCHNPHLPSFPVNGMPKFLRIGAPEEYIGLCSYCHTEATPMSSGYDLAIESSSGSVAVQRNADGSVSVQTMVNNRGNQNYPGGTLSVSWEDNQGVLLFIGTAVLPMIGPDQAVLVQTEWYTPPVASESGFLRFQFASPAASSLNSYAPAEYVRGVTLPPAPANNPPTAGDDFYGASEDTTLIVPAPGVLGNDADIDGDVLTAVRMAGPANGTLTLNAGGYFTYAPNPNFNGTDSFTYQANDGRANSNIATVTIVVNPVNDAPVASAGPDKTFKLNVTTTFNGSGSYDVDGSIANYSWNFGDGTTATGVMVTKRYRKTGTYTVTLTVTDNLGATGTDTAIVTVTK